ncbi:MAG TPA: CPBP family intramembrane glutamic endopeptidase [Alphaproteobacteria bacterium]|jgi:membrane protease YdiL (CAAX protease family)|nr:CPBP family intramembrane glutamic endopeptidase [Alphaproteobacteria bacterium]
MTAKTTLVKNVTIYATYLIIFWAFYRFLIKLPDEVEELIIKPLVWLIPVFYFTKKESLNLSSLGLTFKNLFSSVYLSLGLGAIFVIEGILTNFLKYGHFNFGANIGSTPLMFSLGLSFATAFSEELAFRGYIFSRLWMALKDEWTANVVTTLLWTGIHVPIAFFIWKLNLAAGLTYLMLTAIFGIGSAFIYGKTKNIWGSIFLHVLWEWPIILFR